MSAVVPLATIPVGVVIERSKSASPWAEFYWRPVNVLTGVPETAPWTKLSEHGEHATFYAGSAEIKLYRTETSNYRDNLALALPLLWVVLQPVERDPPFELMMVTADPAEGEAMTEAGVNLVDTVPMPLPMQEAISAFIAEHHVEQVFVKRKRDRANPEALGRHGPSLREDRK
ncbi:MAG TPA: DUF3305 domain-containing protein [Pseudolabrys sp.]|nr:DUF3305 domain-containing protein [Pseudolabrys sp.]